LKLTDFIISPDLIISCVVCVICYLILPECLNNTMLLNTYGTAISALSIIFSVFFAALSFLISNSSDNFVKYLKEKGFYKQLISLYKFTLISSFIALVYTIVLYLITNWWISVKCDSQTKWLFIIFIFLFCYSLIATFMSALDSIKYENKRIEFLSGIDKLNEK